MGFRFRRRPRVIPGVWLNLSKSGVSAPIGGRGLTLNLTQRGARPTVGIPGTGLSWRGRRIPLGDCGASKEAPNATGPGDLGEAAGLAAAFLILALVGLLTLFSH